MKNLEAFRAAWVNWFNPDGREELVKDYLVLLNHLVWQRQGSFFAAAILAALYFDPILTFVTYALVVLTEMLDLTLCRKSKNWDGQDPVVGRQILRGIAINTLLSAIAISIFIVTIAVQQPLGGHFTPLFFLFSASLFAAMYNSQMTSILLLRLSIYGLAFLFIAFLDVLRYAPPLSSPIWLEFFTIIFVLYFLIDISVKFYRSYHERLEQMEVIKEENERTKAALAVKSQFLSTVSHELRTPLTSIIGGLDLVNNGVLGEVPASLRPVIGIATKNGHRLANLIDDLLDLQKIESGEIVFHFKALDANDLVDEAVESIMGSADKLGIRVTSALSDTDARFLGDRSRMMQVMKNLLSNALKFSSPGGTVNVQVSTLGSRIRISVQDNGMGIPEGAKDRVFGKFTQVDSSDVRKVEGSGLGLNITKTIIERHTGSIDYVSELGAGSTFWVELAHLSPKAEGGVAQVHAAARGVSFDQTMARP